MLSGLTDWPQPGTVVLIGTGVPNRGNVVPECGNPPQIAGTNRREQP